MRVYFLFDKPQENEDMSFIAKHISLDYVFYYPQKVCCSLRTILEECKKCIDLTCSGDILICWYDFMGVVCWLLCKIYNKHRNIISINLLLKKKRTIKNFMARILYKKALSSPNFYGTVTSRNYGDWVNSFLHININYMLLHDVYHAKYESNAQSSIVKKSVFCGGRNGRNWGLLAEIAKELPEFTFFCVMSSTEYNKNKKIWPSNCVIKTDLSYSDFLEYLIKSELVVIPLNTEAPAGITVFFQAAANHKPVITSDTVTTKEYFSNGRGILCKDRAEEWAYFIRYISENTEVAKKYASSFLDFLERSCTEDIFSSKIQRLIKKVSYGQSINNSTGL